VFLYLNIKRLVVVAAVRVGFCIHWFFVAHKRR